MKLLAYTIGGQKIGIDIQTWDDTMLSGNTAFLAIADTGSTPTDYVDISSTVYWDQFGGLTTLTPAEIKSEILKLIPNEPTAQEYEILEGYMNVGIDSMTKVGDTSILGNISTGTTTLTGITDATVYGSELHLVTASASTSTTSTTPVTKIEMITDNLQDGMYKVSVAWLGSYSNDKNFAQYDVVVNGVPQGVRSTMQFSQPKDTNPVIPFYKVLYIPLSGVNTILLRYWSSHQLYINTISDATVEIIRIKIL